MIWRFGCVRIFQMPGSRLRMRAAPSNSWSIASKIDPFVVAMCAELRVDRACKRATYRARRCKSTACHVKSAAANGKQRWERETLEPALRSRPSATPRSRRSPAGRSIGSTPPEDVAGIDYARDIADPGRVPVHARHPPDRLPRQALDDAAVRRVRHARGDQRALQGAARGRRHRPERRVRPADADGPRSGSRAVARRSGEVRRQRHVARRHGDAVRRHRARRHHDVDDDQLAGAR